MRWQRKLDRTFRPVLPLRLFLAGMLAPDGVEHFDGPEPAQLRPLLDALRELPPPTLPPPTPEQRERAVRRMTERRNALYPRGQAPAGGEVAQPRRAR